MLKLENTEVVGWEHAIRGMRNPKNSWERSDTVYIPKFDMIDFNGDFVKTVPSHYKDILKPVDESDSCFCSDSPECEGSCPVCIGPNDYSLMMSLAKGGPVHAKYRRMIIVYVDITAPLYWWKEFDTYKIGTVANSCSTMHKIHDKEFTLDDFSCEHLMCKDISNYDYDYTPLVDISPFRDGSVFLSPSSLLNTQIELLNICRNKYLETKNKPMKDEKAREGLIKNYWWQLIQLLPSSYNQKRTVMMNYEVLAGIYPMRKDHKLDEWHVFCDWIEKLPYSELIIGES